MINEHTYKGVFENDFMKCAIEIKNDLEYLRFELEGFKFEGMSFDDFELLNYNKYSKKELEKFSFNKISCGQGFAYELCDCIITIYIPTLLRDMKREKVFEEKLKIQIKLGKSVGKGMTEDSRLSLSLKILNKSFFAENYDFEDAANDLKSQIEPSYKLNNCFGCNFSDYSPLGKAIFGDMLCFKNQKKQYIKVKNKGDLLRLEREERTVQETHHCEDFQLRGNNIGYRG